MLSVAVTHDRKIDSCRMWLLRPIANGKSPLRKHFMTCYGEQDRPTGKGIQQDTLNTYESFSGNRHIQEEGLFFCFTNWSQGKSNTKIY